MKEKFQLCRPDVCFLEQFHVMIGGVKFNFYTSYIILSFDLFKDETV